MKVLILGNGASIHTIKWVNGLLSKGLEIILCSLNDFDESHFNQSMDIHLYSFGLNKNAYFLKDGSINKINYFKALPALRKIYKKHQPDIIHCHYGSSYGFLGALLGKKPFVTSIWGSDIYDFPQKNIVFSRLIKWVLKKSDVILSTSDVMVREINKYTDKKVIVTPFGVDIQKFKAYPKKDKKETFIIGTIKTLENKYGIDTLIEAFAILVSNQPDLDLQLRIIGTGPDEHKLKELVQEKKLVDKVVFHGFVENNLVPEFLNDFDVFVALSRLDSESFGVAVVEAMACEKPVVVSNVDGFGEVVDNAVSGYIVPKEDPVAASEKIELLMKDASLRIKMGQAGRKKVVECYDWQLNLDKMVAVYKKVITKQ